MPVFASLLDTVIRPISFWGYCTFTGEARWRSLDEHFEILTANERPQFLMAHIGVPGHTDYPSYRHADQAQRNAKSDATLRRSMELRPATWRRSLSDP